MLEICCFKAKKPETDGLQLTENLAILLSISGRMMDGVLYRQKAWRYDTGVLVKNPSWSFSAELF